jgi:hypothetical protein
MTNLEAIQSTAAGYPLTANTYQKVLTDRGITATDTYSGRSKAFELATADIFTVLATAASVSEGGFSVSLSDRSFFARAAETIYRKHEDAANTTPKVRSATNRW